MKDTLQPGLTFEFKFRVPENKTSPTFTRRLRNSS
jgi:hypothetical protein